MRRLRIAIASDHAGYELKEKLKRYLLNSGFIIVDFGTHTNRSVDYPDYAFKVAKAVSRRRFDRGILICGTGIGMSIAANKVKGVRAAVCWNEKTAELSRKHNNANILCLGARVIGYRKAKKIVDVWLTTSFEGNRHLRRVRKISQLEKGHCCTFN